MGYILQENTISVFLLPNVMFNSINSINIDTHIMLYQLKLSPNLSLPVQTCVIKSNKTYSFMEIGDVSDSRKNGLITLGIL